VELTYDQLLIRDLSGFKDPQQFPRRGGFRVVFDPNAKYFAVARAVTKKDGEDKRIDRTVTIHDTDGKLLHTLPVSAEQILSFTADGKSLLAVSSSAGATNVSRWEVATGNARGSWTMPALAVQPQLLLTPDGKTLVRYNAELRQVQLCDPETGKITPETVGAVRAVAFSPDGKYLAAGDRHATRLWNLATGEGIATWPNCPYLQLVFSPDGKLLAGGSTSSLAVHRVADGQKLHELNARPNLVESIAFSPDSSLLAANGDGGTVRVWRVSDGKELRIVSYPRNVLSIHFSPDGSKLLAAGAAGIKVWDTQSGLEIKHFLEVTPVYELQWLSDGRTLAARIDGDVLHLDADTGKVLHKQPLATHAQGQPLRYQLGPGARFLGLLHTQGATLFRLALDAERKRTFRVAPTRDFFPEAAGSVAFSPEGRYLAVGNPEGVISLLRLSEQGQVPELPPLPADTKMPPAGRPQ
jgi:WD40 repeat protein